MENVKQGDEEKKKGQGPFFLREREKMADGLKTWPLSALTRSSKRGHSEVDQSPSKSTSSLSERLNGQSPWPCPDKEAPGPDKNASTAKRRRSLTAEVEGLAPLSSFQKEFMDHRAGTRFATCLIITWLHLQPNFGILAWSRQTKVDAFKAWRREWQNLSPFQRTAAPQVREMPM